MEQIRNVIRSMIEVSEEDLDKFLEYSFIKTFKRKSLLCPSDVIPHEIFFVNSGLVRVIAMDSKGVEHSTHFTMENQFITDYSAFLLKQPSVYALQALEDTEVVVLPRKAIEQGYEEMEKGDRLGRLIAEGYFIYFDNRIKDLYFRSPKERYDIMSTVFPDIHNRVPQHMIASYIGISPIHLSRLKKEERSKL